RCGGVGRCWLAGKPRGPQILHRPSAGPLDARDLVEVVGICPGRGVELMEGLDDESVVAQDADPLAVTGMELGPSSGPTHPAQTAVRPHESLARIAPLLRYAEGDQDAVGQKHQPSSWAQQPRR